MATMIPSSASPASMLARQQIDKVWRSTRHKRKQFARFGRVIKYPDTEALIAHQMALQPYLHERQQMRSKLQQALDMERNALNVAKIPRNLTDSYSRNFHRAWRGISGHRFGRSEDIVFGHLARRIGAVSVMQEPPVKQLKKTTVYEPDLTLPQRKVWDAIMSGAPEEYLARMQAIAPDETKQLSLCNALISMLFRHAAASQRNLHSVELLLQRFASRPGTIRMASQLMDLCCNSSHFADNPLIRILSRHIVTTLQRDVSQVSTVLSQVVRLGASRSINLTTKAKLSILKSMVCKDNLKPLVDWAMVICKNDSKMAPAISALLISRVSEAKDLDQLARIHQHVNKSESNLSPLSAAQLIQYVCHSFEDVEMIRKLVESAHSFYGLSEVQSALIRSPSSASVNWFNLMRNSNVMISGQCYAAHIAKNSSALKERDVLQIINGLSSVDFCSYLDLSKSLQLLKDDTMQSRLEKRLDRVILSSLEYPSTLTEQDVCRWIKNISNRDRGLLDDIWLHINGQKGSLNSRTHHWTWKFRSNMLGRSVVVGFARAHINDPARLITLLKFANNTPYGQLVSIGLRCAWRNPSSADDLLRAIYPLVNQTSGRLSIPSTCTPLETQYVLRTFDGILEMLKEE